MGGEAVAAVPAAFESEAVRTHLAEDPAWRALLHMQRPAFGLRDRSTVRDPRFFLGPKGGTDPDRELVATLDAFFARPEEQCRFVARRRWLAERLPGLEAALPPVACAEYAEWRRGIAAQGVVLVFAASYLNSPSSMYGHTFLRFDSAEPTNASPLLAWALNFGATIPAGDNDVLYAWRGLVGGYPGFFGAAPYFEKLREYVRLENRDLWEYRLDLTPDEIDRLLAHTWELRGTEFDYFFLRGNCSLRLLELLDTARPGLDLARRFPLAVVPVDTVRAVRDAGLVTEVTWRPSNRAVVATRFDALAGDERRLARDLAEDPAVSATEAYRGLAADRRRDVAAAAYALLRYRVEASPRDEEVARRSYELLRLVSESAGPAPAPTPPRPVRPEEGHRTALVSVAPGAQDGRFITDVELRFAYHDLLDNGAGYPDGSSLNMARVVARVQSDGDVRLQRLDLIEITSLAPRNDVFRPWSWRVDGGWDRQWTGGRDVLTTQVNGGAGVTRALGDAALAFALLTARLEYNDGLDHPVDFAGGIAAGLRLDTPLGRTLLMAEQSRLVQGVDRTVLTGGHEVSLARNLALRAGVLHRRSEDSRSTEATLGLRWYF